MRCGIYYSGKDISVKTGFEVIKGASIVLKLNLETKAFYWIHHHLRGKVIVRLVMGREKDA